MKDNYRFRVIFTVPITAMRVTIAELVSLLFNIDRCCHLFSASAYTLASSRTHHLQHHRIWLCWSFFRCMPSHSADECVHRFFYAEDVCAERRVFQTISSVLLLNTFCLPVSFINSLTQLCIVQFHVFCLCTVIAHSFKSLSSPHLHIDCCETSSV